MSSPERQLLARLVRRNQWYFGHLLELAAGLDPAVVEASAAGSYGSIRETMFHVVDALKLWDTRLHGTSPTELRLVPRDSDDAALQAAMAEVSDAFVAWLDDASLDLDERMHYRSTRGDERYNRRGDAILQPINHASHHLAQVSTLLTQAGAEPLEGDYIYWVVETEKT